MTTGTAGFVKWTFLNLKSDYKWIRDTVIKLRVMMLTPVHSGLPPTTTLLSIFLLVFYSLLNLAILPELNPRGISVLQRHSFLRDRDAVGPVNLGISR